MQSTKVVLVDRYDEQSLQNKTSSKSGIAYGALMQKGRDSMHHVVFPFSKQHCCCCCKEKNKKKIKKK